MTSCSVWLKGRTENNLLKHFKDRVAYFELNMMQFRIITFLQLRVSTQIPPITAVSDNLKSSNCILFLCFILFFKQVVNTFLLYRVVIKWSVRTTLSVFRLVPCKPRGHDDFLSDTRKWSLHIQTRLMKNLFYCCWYLLLWAKQNQSRHRCDNKTTWHCRLFPL